jgi:hypothetical protein
MMHGIDLQKRVDGIVGSIDWGHVNHQKMAQDASLREGFMFYLIVAVGRLNRICSVARSSQLPAGRDTDVSK